jgi:hypothetical protein
LKNSPKKVCGRSQTRFFIVFKAPSPLLAFYIHQILELCDLNYQYCRSKFSSRERFENRSARIAVVKRYCHSPCIEIPGVNEKPIAEMATIFKGRLIWSEDLIEIPLGTS